jgi:DNA-binding Lrp family transcriptional regulator
MVTAIVLMNVDRTTMASVAEQLSDLPSVSEVYSVSGRFDLAVLVRVRTNEELADAVTKEFATLSGIERTETLVAFRVYSRHDLESAFSLGARDADP